MATIYEVREHTDKIEGRGATVHVAFCGSKELAETLAKGLGPGGESSALIEHEATYHDGVWLLNPSRGRRGVHRIGVTTQQDVDACRALVDKVPVANVPLVLMFLRRK